jgi:hypothetical protein
MGVNVNVGEGGSGVEVRSVCVALAAGTQPAKNRMSITPITSFSYRSNMVFSSKQELSWWVEGK